MPDDQNVGNPTPEKGGKKKVVIFSSAGLVTIIAAAFLFTTFAVPAPPDGNDSEVTDADGGISEAALLEAAQDIYDLPVIMVNIKGTNKKRILKVHLNVVYEAKKPETSALLFENKMPEVKDALTTMLTEKTLEELEGKDDLIMLRMELMDEINRVVFPKGEGRVVKVYYEEFLIQ
ncbi:MAG: flagellar basal body-associated FliL family protein [Planctomycetes bacterium]|nr:flagellar basal body-associated FliL family protein [Planctomycetota bacterium]